MFFADRRAGLTPVKDGFTSEPQSVHGELPEGRSRFDSSGTTRARASVVYPGATVAGGAGLVCGELGGAFPEPFATIFRICEQNKDYPLSVQADADTPDAATPGSVGFGRTGDPLSANAGSARAHAGRDYVATDAVLHDLTVLGPKGLPAAVKAFGTAASAVLGRGLATAASDPAAATAVHVDKVVSRTSQRFAGKVLTVVAEARLEGVSLAGGAVTIDSVLARTVSRTQGDGPPVTEAVTTYQGVRVAGQPAEIGSRGVVVGPAGSPVASVLNEALAKLLGSTGMSIRALGATQRTEGIQTSGDAQGLLVRWELDLTGLRTPPDAPVANPADVYFASVQLASAGGAAFADLSDLGLGETASDTSDGGQPEGPTDLGLGGADLGEPTLGPTPGTATPVAHGGTHTRPGVEAATPGLPYRRADLLGGLAARRISILYLAFTLSALGLAVAPRVALPPRWPRAQGPGRPL